MSYGQWLDLTLVGVCFGFSLVPVYLIWHFSRQIWVYRHYFWMQARHSEFEIICLSVMGALFTIDRPLALYDDLITQERPINQLDGIKYYIRVIVVSLAMMSISYIVLDVSLNIWHQYFSAHLAIQMEIANWRSLIDDSLINEDMSWFIRSKNTWGNRAFLDRVIFVVWVCVVIITLLLTAVIGTSETPVYLALAIIGLISTIIFHFKYPSFRDEIFLRSEKRGLALLYSCYIGTWLLLGSLPSIFGWTWEKNHTKYAVALCISYCFYSGFYLMILYIHGPFVIAHFIRPSVSISICGVYCLPLSFPVPQQGPNNTGTPVTESTKSRPDFPKTASVEFGGVYTKPRSPSLLSMNSVVSQTSSNVNMCDILGNNDAFSAFMQHLFAEFSYENALCLIELIKWRAKVKQLVTKIESKPPMTCQITPQMGSTPVNNTMINPTDQLDHTISMQKDEIVSDLSIVVRSQSTTAMVTSDNFHNLCSDITESSSSIVRGMTSIDQIPLAANSIVDKYMIAGSDFQINVSFTVNSYIVNQVRVLNMEETDQFVTIFDPIIRETEWLLRDSLSRFTRTELFRQLDIQH